MRCATTLSLFMLLTGSLIAQDDHVFPDTLYFCAPVDVQQVTDLDRLGTVVAELPEVHAKLVEMTGAWYGRRYAIAVEQDGGYAVHPVLMDGAVNEVQAVTADILGNGHLQVVLRTMHYVGHTGWEHAIHERDRAITVWDLQAGRCLLRLVHGQSREAWTNTFGSGNDSLPYDQRTIVASDGERSCAHHEVSFTTGTFTLTPQPTCPDGIPSEGVELGGAVRYQLFDGGWVKQ
ncbi:MAG: hypothetical protein IPM12_04700 [Flavobacteriales bacterium]|nr:hypothetical protein [Flavobacteriales bacterium]